MIILSRNDYEKILNHAKKESPIEACGLLAGIVDGEKKFVKEVRLLTNIDRSPEHFSMDPKEQFEALKHFRENKFVLIGNFHSHPQSPARPSEEDKRLAFDSKLSYLILSLMDKENPVLKSFIIEDGNSYEEDILIED
ncbi:M67 family metallopeptidase [Thermoanaerobacterium saccharolyticum]|uniref:M67 family metallopeptidase n=1 Tax=Thermoanaerobacterium TaxID=28895 RepID=UPI002FD99984